MKMLRIFIIILFCVMPLHAFASDGYETWKKQAVAEFSRVPIDESGKMTFVYGKDTPEMRRLVKLRFEEAHVFVTHHGIDPVLWWLLGELAHLNQLLYHIDLKKEGKPYVLDAPENQALIKEYQSYYRKALDFNDVANTPSHLTREMLGRMADDVLSPPDIKQRALKKELEIANAGTQPVDNLNYEWVSRPSVRREDGN